MRSTSPRAFIACIVLILIAFPLAATATIAPAITTPIEKIAMSPSEGYRGSDFDCYITGGGFVTGDQISLERSGGGTIIDATLETSINSTHFRCHLVIPGTADFGDYNLRVARSRGLPLVVSQNAFTVYPFPSVFAIAPNRGGAGETLTSVVVSGAGFRPGMQVALHGGSMAGTTQFDATDEAVLDSSHVRCTLPIPYDAYPGSYTVSVQNPNMQGPETSPGGFTVDPLPTVTGIIPDYAVAGKTLTAHISGSGFKDHAEVIVAILGGTSIPVTDVSLVNSGDIQCTLSIPSGATAGSYTVMVRNPAMTAYVQKFDAFTVFPRVTVTGVSPNSGAPGGTIDPVDIYGSAFNTVTTVSIGNAAGNLQVTDVQCIDATHISCRVVIPNDALPGAYDVYVQNGMSSASGIGAFTVIVASSPVVTVPGGIAAPRDLDANGKYEDVNGNGRRDFADIVLYFNQMSWIAQHEPMAGFDYNGNGRIDFADVVWLFNHL